MLKSPFTLVYVILTSTLLFFSCKKEVEPTTTTPGPQDKSISFPLTGANGDNLLALHDSVSIVGDTSYSFGATLGKDAYLKVVLTNLSTNNAHWYHQNVDGWTLSNYDEATNTQEFMATSTGDIDLNLTMVQGPGFMQVDYYVNSSHITESKIFDWD